MINYQSLKERFVSQEFSTFKNAIDICRILCADKLYFQFFPDLVVLARIAMTIPLSSCWPERGFSTLTRVKTKYRNRLLDNSLSALISVSMNSPSILEEADARAIAEMWLDKRSVA